MLIQFLQTVVVLFAKHDMCYMYICCSSITTVSIETTARACDLRRFESSTFYAIVSPGMMIVNVKICLYVPNVKEFALGLGLRLIFDVDTKDSIRRRHASLSR